MPKSSGLGARLFVHGVDLSGDTGSINELGGGHATFDVTGIDKSAFERIGGQRDGRLGWASWFNPEAGMSHEVLSALPRSDVIVSYLHRPQLGSPAFSLVSKQIGYDGTRPATGEFSFSLSAQANGYGGEWGELLTAGRRVDAAATDGAGVDFGAATAHGLQAWLHVFAFDGTDATVKLQQSSDNGAGDAWTDIAGAAFAAVTTGPQAQRIQTARGLAVERYLRVVTTTTGGLAELDFAVSVMKNPVEVRF
jgi:hypothetical protein